MKSGSLTVTTTATAVCTLSAVSSDVLVQNNGNVPIFLGDSTVAASGDAAGISLAAGATLQIPGVRGAGTYTTELYAVTASDSGTLAFLVPA